MTNPAGAPFQVMGVWHKDLVAPIAETLQKLGTKRALVAHGLDGLDEFTVAAKTSVAEVTPEYIKFFEAAPEDFGLETVSDISDLRGGDAAQNAAIVRAVLENKRHDAARSLVLINAAAAIYAGGKTPDFRSSADLAAESLDSGSALAKLDELRAATTDS
jgi:anthranilate phosphoribosyltransferase